MKWLKEELAVNRKEFLGIVALMSFGLIALFIQFLPSPKEQQYDFTIDDILLENQITITEEETTNTFVASSKKQRKSVPTAPRKTQKKQSFERFDFDPNSISKDSLIRLGFKNRVAETWTKFREKGKRFYNQDDVLSIYGIDTNLVLGLNHHFVFNKKTTDSKPKKIEKWIAKEEKQVIKPIQKIDLNSCKEEDLKKLGGIGQIFASRIIKYRELLGGYADKEQLLKVYGLQDSTYQLIKDYIEVSSPPNKIKINTASKTQLSDHFLLDYKSAKLIYAYRKEHGPFIDQADFDLIKGIPEQKKKEIKPYLSFAL